MKAEPSSPSDFEATKKLPSNVLAAGWVSFFTDLGSELIYPILPAFLTGNLHASRTMVGVIEGIAEATPSIFKLLAGFWADRVKNRKWLVFLGYFLSSCIRPFIGLAGNSLQVLSLRFVDKVGKGIRTAPRDALIADSTPTEIRGMAFGFHRAMDHLGALGGALVAWFLLQYLGLNLQNVIFFSAIPGFFCLITILLLIREVPERKMGQTTELFSGINELPSNFWKLVLGSGAFAIANSSDAFLLLRAEEIGVSIKAIPLIWAFLHLVKAVTCFYGGKFSDRFGPRLIVAGGWILYSGVYLGFAYVDSPAWVWFLFGVYGFFFGATEGVAKAWVAKLIVPARRGTAYGVLGMVEGLLLLPASILTGMLWDSWGSFVPLAFASGISFLSAIWLLFSMPSDHTHDELK